METSKIKWLKLGNLIWRVTTTEQNLDLQLTALKEAGCRRIYQEKISGAKLNRPELQRLIE